MATGDDTRSKFLLSKEALPTIEIPQQSVHEKREFSLPAAIRPDAASAADPPLRQGDHAPAAKPSVTETGPEKRAGGAAKSARQEAVAAARPPHEELRSESELHARASRTAADRSSAVDEPLGGEEDAEGPRPGGVRYVIGAAVILLVGGISYWLATRGSSEDRATAEPTPAVSSAAQRVPEAASPDLGASPTAAAGAAVTATSPTPAANAGVAPEAVQTFSATVETEPAQAMVELVGTDEVGTAPATFDGLDASRQHTVLVSKAGFVSKEVPLDPTSTAPIRVKLDSKPKILRVETVPEGALVYIERRRIRGKLTPLEEPVPRWLLQRKRFKVGIRKDGHVKLDVWVPVDEGWLEETDVVVYNLEGKLELAPTAPVKRHRKKPPTRSDELAAEPLADEEPDEARSPDDDAEPAPDESPTDEKPSAPPAEPPVKGDEPAARTPRPEPLPPTPTPDWQ